MASKCPPFPVRIVCKGADDVVCVRRTYEEALERCAANLEVSASQVELRIGSHGVFFPLDPRDWTKVEPTDELHAVKKSKGKEPARRSSSNSNSAAEPTSSSKTAKRKVQPVVIASDDSDTENPTSILEKSRSLPRKDIETEDRGRKRSKFDKTAVNPSLRHNTPPRSSSASGPQKKASGTPRLKRNEAAQSRPAEAENKKSLTKSVKKASTSLENITLQKSSRKRWQETETANLMKYVAQEIKSLKRPINPSQRADVFENICRKHSTIGGSLSGRTVDSLVVHVRKMMKKNQYRKPFADDLDQLFARRKKSSSASMPLEQDYFIPGRDSSNTSTIRHNVTIPKFPKMAPLPPLVRQPSKSSGGKSRDSKSSSSSSSSSSEDSSPDPDDSDSDSDSDDSRELATETDERETTSASSTSRSGPPLPPPSEQQSDSNSRSNSISSHKPQPQPRPSLGAAAAPLPPSPRPRPAVSAADQEDEEVDELLNDSDHAQPERRIPTTDSNSKQLPIWARQTTRTTVPEDVKPDVVDLDRRLQLPHAPSTSASRAYFDSNSMTLKNRDPPPHLNVHPAAPVRPRSLASSMPPENTTRPTPGEIPLRAPQTGSGSNQIEDSGLPNRLLGSLNQSQVHPNPGICQAPPSFPPGPPPPPPRSLLPHNINRNPSNHQTGFGQSQAGPSNYMKPDLPVEVVIKGLPSTWNMGWVQWLLGPFEPLEIQERRAVSNQMRFAVVSCRTEQEAREVVRALDKTRQGDATLKVELSHRSQARLAAEAEPRIHESIF